ncbi:hypothetical protein L2Y96_13005 [Luteibacter aegosomaticola]|uniref:hypothetical protein n=1 Tax=Luteibacter aegosomaticola TaxID=2911538 RepID=UPI001FF71D0E|nr:hypothetical protein [Luteibacter aegosomaticola]UPG88339.1 hypothetical protein L2Y96_13005 [Luteibacter aegosomaticola]
MSKARISVNKLGEYLTATPARRRRIVQDQKAPKEFIVTRYSDARQEIVSFLADGMEDEQSLRDAALHLRQAPGTDFVRQDKAGSADAIDDFLETTDQLVLDGLVIEPVDSTVSAQIDIAGVTVSVRPDVLLKTKAGHVAGAIKFHFPKTYPLLDKGAEYVAATLREYLVKQHPSSEIDPKHCLVVDVPARVVTHAAKASKKKMADIEAACEEINARWQLSG